METASGAKELSAVTLNAQIAYKLSGEGNRTHERRKQIIKDQQEKRKDEARTKGKEKEQPTKEGIAEELEEKKKMQKEGEGNSVEV